MDRVFASGIIPVSVIDDASHSVPLGEALLAGGINVVEVTFRTDAAAESIQRIREVLSDILVGAGTIVNLDQCKRAVDSGASFIVSPGFSEEIVSWCCLNNIPVFPGCVTPTEVMKAMAYGLSVLKFFPANIYGGLAALKALSGPFQGVRFIPTGGINNSNVGEYISSPFVYAAGGSWLCPRADIAQGNFTNITKLCKEARAQAIGFEACHFGINTVDEQTAEKISAGFEKAFGFIWKKGNSSIFPTPMIEVLKSPGRGINGHIAIRTNRVEMAIEELERRGFAVDKGSLKYKDGRLNLAYLEDSFGGFDVHLIQR